MDRKLIDLYEQGGDQLRRSITGLSDADLKAFPVPGTWSIQQIVIHLADSDAIWVSRMKLIIAEDQPTILGYDESKFISSLFPHEQSVSDALTLFELNRKQFAIVLRKLPEAAFQRTGQHSERGQIGLGESIELMVQHIEHHLKFVREKRAKLGKPLND